MKGINIQLDATEQVALQHHAENLGVDCDDIIYIAVQRLLADLQVRPQPVGHEIIEARNQRHLRFAGWSRDAQTSQPPEDDDYAVPGL